MARRLKTLGECPPEPVAFSYFHAETRHRSGPFRDYPSLIIAYKEHRLANGLEIPQNYDELIQEQICSQLPPELCTYGNGWVNIHLSVSDVIGFMQVLWAHIRSGRAFVPQEEAERRAGICASCYLNVRIAGCGACSQVVQAVAANDKKTACDHLLNNCAVCKCFNQAQVHFPIDVLVNSDSSDRQKLYPLFCWKKKISANYQG